MAYSNANVSRFMFGNEDKYEMANSVRGFDSVDAGVRLGRKDLARVTVDGKILNRTQSPYFLIR